MDTVIQLSGERFEDKGERDARGYYDYYYSGARYTLAIAGVVYSVVCYDNEPGTATFKGTKRDGGTTLKVELSDPAFRAAVEYMQHTYGIKSVSVYVPELGCFKSYEASGLTGQPEPPSKA
jgi:hypothetical protein